MIVHEDRKAPVVAVRVVYHVGAKDEPEGKTGFAHLFEHLLFRGSEVFQGDFAQTLRNAGGSDINATTTYDSTQYFETVPTPALELALWLESGRMGHFLGALTQEMLENERGVVQNEKDEREGGPLAPATIRVRSGLFPDGHPYRRSVRGSMDDLKAASLEDVRAWFRKFYGASNAIVVLAGDIDAVRARALMEKYFGDVPPGEPLARMKTWVPRLSSDVHDSMHARVTQTSVEWFWPAPAATSRDLVLLAMAARLLTGTSKDRLHGELVERRKLATSVSVNLTSEEIAGMFSLGINAKPGADIDAIAAGVNEQLRLFLKEGPTRAELRKLRDDLEVSRMLGVRSVSAKARMLADAAFATGDPSFGERSAQWMREATAHDVRRAAQAWLGGPSYRLTVHPFGDYRAVAADFDRSVMPRVTNDLQIDLPPIQEATLSNGMKVVLVERRELPELSLAMMFSNIGTHADLEGKRGVAAATYALMNSGPLGMSKLAYSERQRKLHAGVGIRASGRHAFSGLAVPKQHMGPALQLWARTVRQPALREADLEAWRDQERQAIVNGRTNPATVVNRTMIKALYPAGHAFAPAEDPEAFVEAIETGDLKSFHAEWVRPDTATLFVVGDTELVEITRELEKVFGDWKPARTPPRTLPAVNPVPVASQPRFILVDVPDAAQTQIAAGRFVLPVTDQQALALDAANDILGGSPLARLGQRLRREKGWSYGIQSSLDGGYIQQYWGLSSAVQSERTAEAVAEILDVIEQFSGPMPATQPELARFVNGRATSLPGMLESPDSVMDAMLQSASQGKPYDWIEGTRMRLDALNLQDVDRLARQYFTRQSLTWVLVGDLSKFERKLRNMNPGTIEVWDTQGRKIR